MRVATNRKQSGFTLIELMVVVAIVAIIAAVAYPSYQNHVVKTRRAAATTCIQELASFMERFYTTNLRYDQTAGTGGTAVALPNIDCRAQLAGFYTFQFAATPTQRAYTLQAVPQGVQASKDAKCGTLSQTQAGARGASGSAGVAGCW